MRKKMRKMMKTIRSTIKSKKKIRRRKLLTTSKKQNLINAVHVSMLSFHPTLNLNYILSPLGISLIYQKK